MGYLRGGISQDEVDHKRLKRLIDTQLLIKSHFQEERKVIFGKLWKLLDFFYLLIQDILALIIIVQIS